MAGGMTPFTGRSGNTPIEGQRIQTGTVAIQLTDQSSGTGAITFSEPFNTPPTLLGTNNQLTVPIFNVISLTTTGATVRVSTISGVATRIVTVSWVAIGF